MPVCLLFSPGPLTLFVSPLCPLCVCVCVCVYIYVCVCVLGVGRTAKYFIVSYRTTLSLSEASPSFNVMFLFFKLCTQGLRSVFFPFSLTLIHSQAFPHWWSTHTHRHTHTHTHTYMGGERERQAE